MEDKTDKELVFEAGRARSIDSASVEMMRRLKDSIEKLDESAQIYSKILVALTLILVGTGFFQIVISVSPSDHMGTKIFMIIGSLFFGIGIYLISKQALNMLFIWINKKYNRNIVKI